MAVQVTRTIETLGVKVSWVRSQAQLARQANKICKFMAPYPASQYCL